LKIIGTKYYSKQQKPGKTKAFFVCLVIAAFLWLAHSLNTVYIYTLKVPVTFKNQPVNKRTVTELPKQLSVNVKASGLKLFLILLNRPFSPVEIDFNNLAQVNKNQNYVLSASGINFKHIFNFEAQIKQIRPDTLYFSEKTGLQKIVAVKVPLQIKCKEGFGYKKPQIEPAFTSIWGDTTLINDIDTLYTQPLTLNGLDQNISTTVTIIKPGKEVYTFINEVTVVIETARLIEQTVTVPLNDVGGSPAGQTTIFPPKVKIRFTSIQNTFVPTDSVLFRAVINSAKTNPKSKKCPVFLTSSPDNITVMEIEPKEVDFIILKK